MEKNEVKIIVVLASWATVGAFAVSLYIARHEEAFGIPNEVWSAIALGIAVVATGLMLIFMARLVFEPIARRRVVRRKLAEDRANPSSGAPSSLEAESEFDRGPSSSLTQILEARVEREGMPAPIEIAAIGYREPLIPDQPSPAAWSIEVENRGVAATFKAWMVFGDYAAFDAGIRQPLMCLWGNGQDSVHLMKGQTEMLKIGRVDVSSETFGRKAYQYEVNAFEGPERVVHKSGSMYAVPPLNWHKPLHVLITISAAPEMKGPWEIDWDRDVGPLNVRSKALGP